MSARVTRSGRPKFTPPATRADIAIEVAALIGLVAVIALLVHGATSLPARVPTHVGPSGIDSYGSKRALLFSFAIPSVVLYGLLTIVNEYPYYFNYPTAITEENAPRIYSFSRRMMRWVKAIMIWWIAAFACLFITILPYRPEQSWVTLLIAVPFLIALAVLVARSLSSILREGRRPRRT